MQDETGKYHHSQAKLSSASRHEVLVEQHNRNKDCERRHELATRSAAVGIHEQGFKVHALSSRFAKRWGVSLQGPAVVVDVGKHQEAVERKGDERQYRADWLVIEDRRPVERAGRN